MVLYIYKEDISLNNGIKIACFGISIAQTTRLNTTERPIKRFFASGLLPILPALQTYLVFAILNWIPDRISIAWTTPIAFP